MVRRLPVLQSSTGEDAEATSRPGLHWLVIAAAWVVTTFLPLSYVATWLGNALSGTELLSGLSIELMIGLLLLALGTAAWSAGAVVGRFGLRAKRFVAPVGAGSGGALLVVITALGYPRTPREILLALGVLLALFAALFAAWGASWGRKRRPKLP